MFESTNQSGFKITFENGWTVSVQWSPFHYCDNRNLDLPRVTHVPQSCKTAEVAVMRPDGRFEPFESDDVIGWVTPNRVAAIIAEVAAK